MPFDSTPVTDPAIQVLEKVHKLFQGKKRWCQFREGEDKYHTQVAPDSKHAYAFCLVGAIRHFTPSEITVDDCISYLGFADQDDLVGWNDDNKRKKAGVRRRLTNRIRKAKEKLLLGV